MLHKLFKIHIEKASVELLKSLDQVLPFNTSVDKLKSMLLNFTCQLVSVLIGESHQYCQQVRMTKT